MNMFTADVVNSQESAKVFTSDLPITSLTGYVDSDGVTNDYLFSPVTDESVKNLAEGIKKEGFKGSINVWKLTGENKGKYMIFSGHRRAKAMQLLNKTEVRCSVYDLPEKEVDRRRQFLGANIYSRGSANATVEGGDIYIARQMKYLENILILEGITSKMEINASIASEFNTSKNKVWRYKTLLSASPKLLEAEEKGIIPLAEAATISLFDEETQNNIIDAANRVAAEDKPFSRNELDNLIKKVKDIQKFSTEENEDVISEELLGSSIKNLVSSIVDVKIFKNDFSVAGEITTEEKKEKDINTSGSESKNKLTVYDKYNIRMKSLWSDVDHGKLKTLKPKEIKELQEQNEQLQVKLKIAYLYSELMAGLYNGHTVDSQLTVSDEDLELLTLKQVREIKAIYKKAEHDGNGTFDSILSQFANREAEMKREGKGSEE